MPHIDAPTWYERSSHIMPSNVDAFFSWFYGEDRHESDTGDTESPLGWVALCRVDVQDIIDFRADPYTFDNITTTDVPEGWYIIRTNDQGFVWAMSYGSGEYTLPEENARADFASAEKVYGAWLDTDTEGV